MTRKPVSINDKIAATAAKRDAAMSIKIDPLLEIKSDVSEEIPGAVQPSKPVAGKPLPKVTLYAHNKVLKAIRHLAVEDGVQAQEILRRAVQAYLATRGHQFTDLTTGT